MDGAGAGNIVGAALAPSSRRCIVTFSKDISCLRPLNGTACQFIDSLHDRRYCRREATALMPVSLSGQGHGGTQIRNLSE